MDVLQAGPASGGIGYSGQARGRRREGYDERGVAAGSPYDDVRREVVFRVVRRFVRVRVLARLARRFVFVLRVVVFSPRTASISAFSSVEVTLRRSVVDFRRRRRGLVSSLAAASTTSAMNSLKKPAMRKAYSGTEV